MLSAPENREALARVGRGRRGGHCNTVDHGKHTRGGRDSVQGEREKKKGKREVVMGSMVTFVDVDWTRWTSE